MPWSQNEQGGDCLCGHAGRHQGPAQGAADEERHVPAQPQPPHERVGGRATVGQYTVPEALLPVLHVQPRGGTG